MSEARPAQLFLARADVVPEIDGHNGRQQVRRDDDAQPIVQSALGKADMGQVGVLGHARECHAPATALVTPTGARRLLHISIARQRREGEPRTSP